MDKIQVMIVDDQALIREGIRMMLSLHDEINIIGEACNGKDALNKIDDLSDNIDVVLMDIRMPEMDGVNATKVIKDKYPNLKIIILTTFNEDEYIFEGLKNGADGYILKDVKSDEIVKGIKTVYSGNILLQPEIATKVVNVFKGTKSMGENTKKNKKGIMQNNKEDIIIEGEYEKLTHRETEISILVAQGKTNKEISNELYITEGTVKNHLTKVLNKLELENRTQLALLINSKYD